MHVLKLCIQRSLQIFAQAKCKFQACRVSLQLTCKASYVILRCKRSNLINYSYGTWHAFVEFCTICRPSTSVLQVMCQCLVHILRDILSDATNITNMIVTDSGYCIYLSVHGQGCIRNMLHSQTFRQLEIWFCHLFSIHILVSVPYFLGCNISIFVFIQRWSQTEKLSIWLKCLLDMIHTYIWVSSNNSCGLRYIAGIWYRSIGFVYKQYLTWPENRS